MTGFKIVNLLKLINTVGEDEVKVILSNFLCPHNADVEKYLKTKAIDFAKQGWAQTHLVYASYKKQMVLVGYFALADKYIHIFPDKQMSNTLRKRIGHFSRYDKELNCYCITAPLIEQLGKNYNNDYNKLISGDELLKIACDKIQSIQVDLGGKFTYLKCEDKPFLTEFYERNEFYIFGKRDLDRDEKGDFETSYLNTVSKNYILIYLYNQEKGTSPALCEWAYPLFYACFLVGFSKSCSVSAAAASADWIAWAYILLMVVVFACPKRFAGLSLLQS